MLEDYVEMYRKEFILGRMKFAAETINEYTGEFGKKTAERLVGQPGWSQVTQPFFDTAWGK